jgi:hypothetical protein
MTAQPLFRQPGFQPGTIPQLCRDYQPVTFPRAGTLCRWVTVHVRRLPNRFKICPLYVLPNKIFIIAH